MKSILFLLFLGFCAGVLLIFGMKTMQAKKLADSTQSNIHIVAAENFYADIAQQIGGSTVHVTSILNDPNIDPHEYESSVHDAIAVHDASIVIHNGLGYDTWMDKLIQSSQSKHRIDINVGAIAPYVLADNPHIWYGIENISSLAKTLATTLSTLNPKYSTQYSQNLQRFISSLSPVQKLQQDIQSQYLGNPVGLTETIFLYQTKTMGLDVLTPVEFQRAIANVNDPSAQNVYTTTQQLKKGKIKVFIYNSQTVAPITTQLLSLAKTLKIPTVSVSETMPESDTYQSWMLNELTNLKDALHQSK